jgi:hypothetical protein
LPPDLFDPASLATAKRMPILNGHPGFRLNSSNIDGLVHGAIGDTFFRERTDSGEFLGAIVTLYTDEAKRLASSMPGVSPGYSVRIDSQRGTNYQRNRVYNHLANAVVPRGGDDVRQVFEGIRVDSADGDSGLWIARDDGECYECDVAEDFASMVFGQRDFRDFGETLISPKAIDLTPYIGRRDRHDKACECDSCSSKAEQRSTRGQGFGAPTPNSKKKKKMQTINIDGIDWEVEKDLAIALMPKLKMAERADSVSAKLEATQEALAEAEADTAALAEEVNRLNSESEGRADSAIDDEYMTVEQATELAVEQAMILANAVDQIRSDGELLVKTGRLKSFNPDFSYIVENMDALQGEMLLAVSPSSAQRIDSYDASELATAYEAGFDAYRNFISNSHPVVGQDPLLQVAQGLRADGDAKKRPAFLMSAMAKKELKAQDNVFDSHGKTAVMSK